MTDTTQVALVSTICDHHFVKIFADREAAKEWGYFWWCEYQENPPLKATTEALRLAVATFWDDFIDDNTGMSEWFEIMELPIPTPREEVLQANLEATASDQYEKNLVISRLLPLLEGSEYLGIYQDDARLLAQLIRDEEKNR